MNERPRSVATAIFLLALLLGLGSINRGLQSDDYIQRHILLDEQTGFYTKISHFYEFFGAADNIPWWTQDDLKIKFWRPLSAFTHWTDYQLWPNSSGLMHVHSLLWYALLSVLVLGFYKRLLEPKLAFMAAILFCLDFSHFANLSWIANRNSLITCCFFVLGFNHYYDWIAKKRVFNYGISLLAFVLALLSGETGIVLLPVILLFELLLFSEQKHPLRENFTSLLPFVALASLWAVFYYEEGFGSANNSMYFSPLADLKNSLFLLLTKIPVFIFGNITSIEGFFNVFPKEIQIFLALICTLILFMIFKLSGDIFKYNKNRFLFFSAIIVLIPVCFFAVADMRLTLFSSIFCAALLAQILYRLANEKQFAQKTLFASLLLLMFFISPLQWLQVSIRDLRHAPESFSSLKMLEKNESQQDIYLLNYPSPIDGYYFPFTQDDTPTSNLFMLNNNFSNYTVSSKNKQQLIIQSKQGLIFKNSDFSHLSMKQKPLLDGVYARSSFNGMISKDFRFYKGEVFKQENFTVEVLASNQYGQVNKLQIRFNQPLVDGQLKLWNNKTHSFTDLSIATLEEKSLVLNNF